MSWLTRWQAARQRRQAVIDDVRRNGWPSVRRELFAKARKIAQAGGERVQRVAHQSIKKAKESGRALALHVIAVQQAARLDKRVMEQSAKSVIYPKRPDVRDPDRAWREGYRAVVAKEMPGLATEKREKEAELEP